jgi:hypothetical protein
MWTKYMEEVKESDTQITYTWKEDANDLVVFVGLDLLIRPSVVVMTSRKTGIFSVVVAAFIIESYKKLSPDTGDQTVVLLRRISQQLASSTDNTIPTPSTTQPPTALIVWVNAMWLASLILSISSALFSTLLQQWARRYIQKPLIRRQQKHRARVRWFLYQGTKSFKMPLVVEVAPTLLHISVFLFFVGLGLFFIPIHKTVGIVVSVVVGFCGLVYLALTILPCFKHNCPYRTPMTALCWYTWHAVLFFAAHFLRWTKQHLCCCLVRYTPTDDEAMTGNREIHDNRPESSEGAVEKHWKYLKDGLDESAIKGPLNAPVNEDRRMLSWLLDKLALVDKSKLRKFVATIPRNTIIQLMTPYIEPESGLMTLRETLLTLVRSCAGTSGHGVDDETVRRRSLSVGLEAVRHVTEALLVEPQPEVLSDVRINFANLISLMPAMWNDGDPAIRLASRSICALLARCHIHKEQLNDTELDWLQDVTGVPSDKIYMSHPDAADALDLANLKYFVYGVLSPQVGDIPTEHTASFERTLAILTGASPQADTDSYRAHLRTRLVTLIEEMEASSDHNSIAVGKLRQIYDSIPQP